MANLWFKNILGQIPSTEKIENAHNQLYADYERFKNIENSAELERYQELKSYLESNEFLDKKRAVESITYASSEEEKLVNELAVLKKNKSLNGYFKTKNSSELGRFNTISSSEKLARFNQIKETVDSGHVDELKKQMDEDHAKELGQEKRYKQLKKSPELKKYFKLLAHPSYITYKKLTDSNKVTDFKDLEKAVNSFDYTQINKENKEKFEEQLTDRSKYKEQKKDPELKTYLKFVAAGHPEFIDKTAQSDLLNEYEALKIYIESSEYTESLQKTDFKQSDLYKLQQEFKSLQKDAEIRFYHKFKNSKGYANYLTMKESKELLRLEELKEMTATNEFVERVEYLKDTKKFEKTDEYKKVEEFEQIKNTADIKWYLATLQSNSFDELKKWTLIFEDDFTGLDNEKWSPVIFPGLVSFNDNYVTEGEKQFFTKGENLSVNNSVLQIDTKQERREGKCWSPKSGFMNKSFDYTSGTLNTAQTFRLNQGKIQAKLSVDQAAQCIHGFSLKGDQITPHIDLFKTGVGNGFEVRYIPEKNGNKQLTEVVIGINVNDKYFIYGMEWNDTELIWTFNNVEVARTRHQLNGETLYLNLATILEQQPQQLPAHFNVDWVRVYRVNA
ncbi:MAG: hypothetical protein PF489_13910 [Salinivirgaceae bacterium]|jgi:hypothetical protein|nr:hypothetical protein [Salinivirgaceae bacterium]